MKIIDYDSGEIAEFEECSACLGLGYHETYYDEYDIHDQQCEACEGEGVIELGK